MNNKRDLVQGLIELAQTSQEADGIIEKHMGYTNTIEKMAFLSGMFNVDIASRCTAPGTDSETILNDDYWATLATIINAKRR